VGVVGGGGGVIQCSIFVQPYCDSVGNAGVRGGNKRRIDSCTKASKSVARAANHHASGRVGKMDCLGRNVEPKPPKRRRT